MGQSCMKRQADPILEKLSPMTIIDITIKTAIKSIELELTANSTVGYLKSAIRDSIGIHENQQELTVLIPQDLKCKMGDGKLVQDYFPRYDANGKKWILEISLSVC